MGQFSQGGIHKCGQLWDPVLGGFGGLDQSNADWRLVVDCKSALLSKKYGVQRFDLFKKSPKAWSFRCVQHKWSTVEEDFMVPLILFAIAQSHRKFLSVKKTSTQNKLEPEFGSFSYKHVHLYGCTSLAPHEMF